LNNESRAGGGLYCDNCDGIVCNNIIAFNTATDTLGGGIGGRDVSSWVAYNDFWENTGGDISGLEEGPLNLFIDPMLADTLMGSYYLSPRSPCINGGKVDDIVPDGGGERIDIGAFEYQLPMYPRVSFEFESLPDTVTRGDSLYITYRLINHTREDIYVRASIEVDGSDGRWFFIGNIYLVAGRIYDGITGFEATRRDFPGARICSHNVYGRVGITPLDLYDITGKVVEVVQSEF
jgi:hypothetical protein